VNFELLENRAFRFSIVLFVLPEDLASRRGEIEQLGSRPNVKLIVQPSPFEGIEFLHRVGVEFPAQVIGIDPETYWHAIRLKKDLPADRFEEIKERHYEYLLAILEQDAKRALRARKALESLSENHRAP
jgi:hypothetical protein